jgi:LysM repeat protein
VIVNTPAEDGSIKYIVQPGETLWDIATAYRVSVDDIKKINRLANNFIYPGDTLIIKKAVATATAGPTETSTPIATFTPFIFWTVTPSPTALPTPVPSAPIAGGNGMIVVGVIIIAALVLAGVLTASGSKKKRPE